MKQSKGLSAWLVTWEWSGEHAKVEQKILEVLDPRISPERVREFVGLLYHQDATLSEKIAWRLRKCKQIYPAEFITLEGVRWTGQIICGHNPWLKARLVDNLVITIDANGTETASWDDRQTPKQAVERIRAFKSK